ncbi:MAG: NAD(P)/FAD-dependent oxidoreductase [Spirochaetes bacterium]|nr:MAG: NAD(P)/FAD-dependent oxidoreductase [Spirochaetota bacterium]
MQEYDIVVIGAGNGGLTAAATGAKQGLRTLLLERHNIPGGCATSFCRGRFEFEVALHQLSGMGAASFPGPLRSTLHSLGVVDEVEWVEMKNLYRVVVPGRMDITLPATRTGFTDALIARFPDEKAGIESFVDLVYRFFNEVIAAVFMRDPEASPQKYPLYYKYALTDAQTILDEHLKDPLLKLAVSVYWSYAGAPPRILTFSDFAAMLFAYIEFKPYHMKHGSQALSNAIVDSFIKNGGDVRFSCGAKKIIIKDGRVAGVVLDTGEEVAARYVISNASPILTCTEMLDAEYQKPEFFTQMGAHTVGPSAYTLYMGLDCPHGDLGIVETTNFICTHTDMNRAYTEMKMLENEPAQMLLTCYNASDPAASPPGTTQVALVDLKYGEPWLSVPPHKYYDYKYAYAEKMLAIVEKLIPGFRSHIEEVEVATPLTHMRYLGTPAGSIYGFDQFIRDSRVFGTLDPGIPGLYFAGAWVGGGGFQPTLMSGASAARAVSKQIRKERG